MTETSKDNLICFGSLFFDKETTKDILICFGYLFFEREVNCLFDIEANICSYNSDGATECNIC